MKINEYLIYVLVVMIGIGLGFLLNYELRATSKPVEEEPPDAVDQNEEANDSVEQNEDSFDAEVAEEPMWFLRNVVRALFGEKYEADRLKEFFEDINENKSNSPPLMVVNFREFGDPNLNDLDYDSNNDRLIVTSAITRNSSAPEEDKKVIEYICDTKLKVKTDDESDEYL